MEHWGPHFRPGCLSVLSSPPSQGASLVGSLSECPQRTLPTGGGAPHPPPRSPQISQQPRASLGVPDLSIRGAVIGMFVLPPHIRECRT